MDADQPELKPEEKTTGGDVKMDEGGGSASGEPPTVPSVAC